MSGKPVSPWEASKLPLTDGMKRFLVREWVLADPEKKKQLELHNRDIDFQKEWEHAKNSN